MNVTASSEKPLRPSRTSREEKQMRRRLWREALRQSSVWQRAVKFGFSVGLLQAAVNQGDLWFRHAVTSTVVVKTIVSPLIGLTLVLLTSAATWVQKTIEQENV